MRLLKDLVGRAPFIPPFTTAAFPALTNTDTNKLEIERAQRTAFQASKRGYPTLYRVRQRPELHQQEKHTSDALLKLPLGCLHYLPICREPF